MAEPLGVILAGGRARRLGGAKATLELAGRPLLDWPLAALRSVLDEVIVVAKRDSPLPPLTAPVWLEPDDPRHPLAGIVHALRGAHGRPVVVCAVDLPLVTASIVHSLATVEGDAVVARADGRIQPLLGRYARSTLERLVAALAAGASATAAATALSPSIVDVPASVLLNVNEPEDLAAVERALAADGG